nr:YqgE/AlgH family protein [uncultured Lacibacter sp.]
MHIRTGNIIISTALLDGSSFEQTVIVIAEQNEKGALGFIINQPFSRSFNELEEFKDSIPVPLFTGGPVQDDQLYFLHRRPDLITDGQLIDAAVYLYGDFKTAVQLLNTGALPVTDVKLFIGYCGWDAHELEAEIAEGSWLLTNATVDIVFDEEPELLWEKLLLQQ